MWKPWKGKTTKFVLYFSFCLQQLASIDFECTHWFWRQQPSLQYVSTYWQGSTYFLSKHQLAQAPPFLPFMFNGIWSLKTSTLLLSIFNSWTWTETLFNWILLLVQSSLWMSSMWWRPMIKKLLPSLLLYCSFNMSFHKDMSF